MSIFSEFFDIVEGIADAIDVCTNERDRRSQYEKDKDAEDAAYRTHMRYKFQHPEPQTEEELEQMIREEDSGERMMRKDLHKEYEKESERIAKAHNNRKYRK